MIHEKTQVILNRKARSIAKEIGLDLYGHSDFRGMREKLDKPDEAWESIEYSGNQIKFVYNRDAYVMLKDVRIVSDPELPTKFLAPIPVDTEIIQSHSSVVTNDSNKDITHTVETKAENESSFTSINSQSIKLGTKVSIKFGADVDPVSAEFSSELEVKAEFSQLYENKESNELISSTEFTIPAKHKGIFTKNVSVGSYRQKFERTGHIECKVEIYSHGDLHHRWDSLSQLKDVASCRVYDDNIPLAKRFRNGYPDRYLLGELNRDDTNVKLLGEIFYDDRSSGDIMFELVPLSQ